MQESGNPPANLYGLYRREYEQEIGKAYVRYQDQRLEIIFPDEIYTKFKDFICECEDVTITCKDIKLTCGSININASGPINIHTPSFTVNAPIINLNGTVTINGNTIINGNLVVSGVVTAAAFVPTGGGV